jgi:hypothetical protein
VGTGGAAALLLAARRQRSMEIALRQKDRDQLHEERVAGVAEADAEARRITELYTTAVDQLGSDKAPVRLGGLYALGRLAQNNPSQRQAIVNVLCAYLRMPFTIPGEPPGVNAEARLVAEHTERVQEREVRLTAQHLLRDRLFTGMPDAAPLATFGPTLDIDLSRATLINFNLEFCQMHTATFHETQFAAVSPPRKFLQQWKLNITNR